MLTVLAIMITAALANDRARAFLYRVVLTTLFGESAELESIGAITPADCTTDYSDGVYEIRQGDTRVIAWYRGVTVRNMIALGFDVAYTVVC